MNLSRFLSCLSVAALLAQVPAQATSQVPAQGTDKSPVQATSSIGSPSGSPATKPGSSQGYSDNKDNENKQSQEEVKQNQEEKKQEEINDYQQSEILADFAPQLLWDNGLTALDFPIQWMTVSNQGTLFLGSCFSKTFTGYSIYNGACKGRQSLPTPTAYPPLIVGTNAIVNDSTTALFSFNADTMAMNWERLPVRPPRTDHNLRQLSPHPRTNKVSPILFADKIVTLNTNGTAVFYQNAAPEDSALPDFVALQTSPDERGTFRITPVIKRQVLYACTTAGHLHFVNLNNIQDRGMIKNRPNKTVSTIGKEVRVPLVSAYNSLLLTTMDGTVNSYSLFHKVGNKLFEPALQWSKHLASKRTYHTNRWGYPVLRPVVDSDQETFYICTKDGVYALECATGDERWYHRVPQGLSCPPMIWSRYLLIVSEPKGDIPAKVTALDPADGHTIASQTLRDAPTSEPVIWNNYFVVGYRNGYAECYDLAGAQDLVVPN